MNSVMDLPPPSTNAVKSVMDLPPPQASNGPKPELMDETHGPIGMVKKLTPGTPEATQYGKELMTTIGNIPGAVGDASESALNAFADNPLKAAWNGIQGVGNILSKVNQGILHPLDAIREIKDAVYEHPVENAPAVIGGVQAAGSLAEGAAKGLANWRAGAIPKGAAQTAEVKKAPNATPGTPPEVTTSPTGGMNMPELDRDSQARLALAKKRDMGDSFTLGQITGDPEQRMKERLLEQLPQTASPMGQIYQSALEKLQGNFEKEGAKLSPNGAYATDHAIGENLKDLYVKIDDNLHKKTMADWNANMNAGAKASGNNRFIPSDNYNKWLDDRLAKLRDAKDIKSVEYKTLAALKDDWTLDGEPAKMSIPEIQSLMSKYTADVGAKGSAFSELGDPAKSRFLSGGALSALKEDLSAAADNPKFGDAAKALQTARDNYSANMKVREALRTRNLGRVLDISPDPITGEPNISGEGVMKKVRSMNADDVPDFRDFLKANAPDVLQDLKRNIYADMVRDDSRLGAIEKNFNPNVNPDAPQTVTNPGSIVDKYENSKTRQIWNALTTAEERKNVQEVMTLASMAAQRMAPGSSTAANLAFNAELNGGVIGAATDTAKVVMQPKKEALNWITNIKTRANAQKALDVALSPSGRRAIGILALSKPGTPSYLAAEATLTGILDESENYEAGMGIKANQDQRRN